MMTYHQRAGTAFINNAYLSTGWSGEKEGYNNPDKQDVPNIGPIPRGFYTIGPSYIHPHLGPFCFDLTPDPTNEMFGRTDFRIHGAAFQHPELSSHGCIILMRPARENINLVGETRLEVKE